MNDDDGLRGGMFLNWRPLAAETAWLRALSALLLRQYGAVRYWDRRGRRAMRRLGRMDLDRLYVLRPKCFEMGWRKP